VTNGASFQQGITPGSIATLFGTHLSNATGINLASGLPLPRQLVGVSMTLNGIQAPIFAVDNVNGQEQINFQVPWELAGQRSASLVVNNNGQANSPVTVNIQLVSPGIFTTNGITGAILHGGQPNLVTSSNPAFPVERVTLFVTGLGSVSPSVATGAAAPIPPPVTTQTPTVTIGGVDVTPEFFGLAPGFVGLYQVNVQVPAIVAAGQPARDVDVIVTIGGVASKPVKMSVRGLP
jgi:uncharacterized protein (TIGR03437 family)